MPGTTRALHTLALVHGGNVTKGMIGLLTRLRARILQRVTLDAGRAIAVIRQCVGGERYGLAVQFTQRMEWRALFWPEVIVGLREAMRLTQSESGAR